MAVDHEIFMRQCFQLAETAVRKGNHPFGALLVYAGEVLLTAENSVITERDRTGHAELNLVRQATRKHPSKLLRDSVLYTSTEPCPMCAGGIYWSGIARVVFGCSVEALEAVTGPSLLIPCREIFARGAEPVEVVGPILENEGVMIHRDFW